MELVKLPVPELSEVLLLVVVGFWVVLQQTPLWVIDAPPSLEMFPPLEAVVPVILVTALVVKVGKDELVVGVLSVPLFLQDNNKKVRSVTKSKECLMKCFLVLV